MSGCLLRSLALAAACGAALPALAAPPEADAPAARQSPSAALSLTVEQLLRAGRPDEAEALIAAALKAAPHNPEARFLGGIVALARKDYAKAIHIFRAMLIDHPDAIRVRLELARAYFLDKDYLNADRQFRLVRTGRHPPEVLANIDQYLFAIRQDKDWSWSLKLALAPDTNLNAATSSREVTLSGLPFELSDQARKRSGIGLAAEGTVEYAPRIGPATRLRLGLAAQRREYSGGEFDDMAVAVHAGPRLVSPRWDTSLLATGFIRWYGGDPLVRAVGGRIEATHYPSPNLSLSGALSAQKIDHARDDTRDGALYSARLGLFHPLGTTSAIAAKASVNRQTAREPAHSNWSFDLSASYFRELPGGFTVGFEPGFGVTRFDAALPVFGKTRSDRSATAEVSLLNRHIVLSRFTPRVSYSLTRQWSNIELYSFTRHRFEIGLTTVF
jgi:outer membrane protein